MVAGSCFSHVRRTAARFFDIDLQRCLKLADIPRGGTTGNGVPISLMRRSAHSGRRAIRCLWGRMSAPELLVSEERASWLDDQIGRRGSHRRVLVLRITDHAAENSSGCSPSAARAHAIPWSRRDWAIVV